MCRGGAGAEPDGRGFVLGGTGYAGAAIVAEAAGCGHAVTAVSRTPPAEDDRVGGVDYVTGSVTDPVFLADVVSGAEVVVSAPSPRGELDGRIGDINRAAAVLARKQQVRLIVIGGFSSLRPAPRETNAIDGGRVSYGYRSEAIQMNDVLADLHDQSAELDWLFVSPSNQFGAHVPGEDLGRYRVGGDVALFDKAARPSAARTSPAPWSTRSTTHRHRGQIGVAY